MVNIDMFRHPNYYKELRKLRNKEARVNDYSASITDRAISQANSTRGLSDVRSGPGLKLQAQCDSQEAFQSQSRASSFRRQAFEPTCSSIRRQASSPRQQASSVQPQAASSDILEPRYKKTEEVFLGKEPRAFTMINVFFG